jgi:hypothetical protein
MLKNCTLCGNSAGGGGGGASACGLTNCTLARNSSYDAGGAYESTLANCIVNSNSATANGGGALHSTLSTCKLTGNSAGVGGGAEASWLSNCLLNANSAEAGGGAEDCTLENCTLTGNSGGGTLGGTLNNCILYFNTADRGVANYLDADLNYCCTTPQPNAGAGNIDADPQLASASHLSANSPCRGAGNPVYASGVDIDGEPWANPPSIGCDEYHAGAITGPMNVSLVVAYTNVVVGYSLGITALIEGRVTYSAWDFGDGTGATNQPFVFHAWAAPGDYALVLHAYNETYPGGINSTAVLHVFTMPVHYVAANNNNPSPPYTSWATAATNIQDAVDAAALPGALVLVTNGTYKTGGRALYGTLTNRVAVDKPLAVRSVNGPQFTVIMGYQVPGTNNGDGAIRCVYLANGASLAGFTLTNGGTLGGGSPIDERRGGGVSCQSATAVVSNCVIVRNSAESEGGGVCGGTLNNCTLTGNSAGYDGGGAAVARLNNCTLSGNSSGYYGGGAATATLDACTLSSNSASASGGGTAFGTLNNCTLSGNTAPNGGGASQSTLSNCTLSSNSAPGFGYGGGSYEGSLTRCTLSGNSAGYAGGGAYNGTLNNCVLNGNLARNVGGGACLCFVNNSTVVSNSAGDGGGAVEGQLNNCVVYLNSASSRPNYDPNSVLNYCCTTPQPTNGIGNITNVPLFVNLAGGDLRMQSNSPCVNAGNDSYAPAGPDLDGNLRIAGGTVDIGAYEFQNPTSLISYAWLQQYGLPIDGSADFGDPDHDGMNNWQEWRAGTNPTNSLSALRIISALPTGTNVTISWQSVAGVNYLLERSTNLVGPASVFMPVATGIPGQDSTTCYVDTNAVEQGPVFYRVGGGF